MPYIKQENRSILEDAIEKLNHALLNNFSDYTKSGAINYTITKLLHKNYNLDHPSYQDINNAIGVLECVKQELYRKKAVPYEEFKILENGDV